MGLHINIAFGNLARSPFAYAGGYQRAHSPIWSPPDVMAIGSFAHPVFMRSPFSYPEMRMYQEPYRPVSLPQLGAGLGVLAATARYGPVGFFGALAAMAIGNSISNSLGQNSSFNSAGQAPAMSAAPSVSTGRLTEAINGLDNGTSAAPAEPAHQTQRVAYRIPPHELA